MPTLSTVELWAGTESALNDYMKAVANIEAFGQAQAPDDEELPRLLSIQNGVAVVSVHGPLTNRDAWYNRYAGVVAYNEIREAIIHAAQDVDVGHIMLDVNSGGGSVAGVADTAALISMVNSRVKPVTAFTDGSMASAAYWLGAAAGKVYASKTAVVGSIGVIATHTEQSKMLEKAGIGVTVIRSGKYKALANGVEPLTEEARAQIQANLDAVYKVFVQHVAEARNVSYDIADAQMAQGREFMGEAAVGAGLVDGISSYDTLFNSLSKELIDTSEKLIDNSKKSIAQEWGMGKKALSDIEITALAEGATLTGEAGEAGTPAPEGAAGTQGAPDPEGAAGEAGTPAPEGTAGTQGTPAGDASATAGVVEYLKGQIKEKDADLLAANVAIDGLKREMDEIKAAHEGLLKIAAKSVSNMQVALGGGVFQAEGLPATQVLAEHARVSQLFSNKFKAGGVAAVDAGSQNKSEQAVDALTRARLKAASLSK